MCMLICKSGCVLRQALYMFTLQLQFMHAGAGVGYMN